MPVLEVIERTTERAIPIDAAPLPICTPADPFGIDHDCMNPAGHHFISSCRDVVCVHCARIAWQ